MLTVNGNGSDTELVAVLGHPQIKPAQVSYSQHLRKNTHSKRSSAELRLLFAHFPFLSHSLHKDVPNATVPGLCTIKAFQLNPVFPFCQRHPCLQSYADDGQVKHKERKAFHMRLPLLYHLNRAQRSLTYIFHHFCTPLFIRAALILKMSLRDFITTVLLPTACL